MLELKDGFVLYHGSYCEIKDPDLAKCAKRDVYKRQIPSMVLIVVCFMTLKKYLQPEVKE